MTLRWHGENLLFYESGDSLEGVDLGKPAVSDAYFPEGKGYFENPRLESFESAGELKAAVALAIPVPGYIPGSMRSYGQFAIRTPSAAISDIALVYIERDVDSVKLAHSIRPLGPDDAAIKVFYTWRPTPVLVYEWLGVPSDTREAKLRQLPHELVDVAGMPAVLMRFEVTEGGEPLRLRQIPNEFVTWYDPRLKVWLSIHSSAPVGEAIRIAEGMYA